MRLLERVTTDFSQIADGVGSSIKSFIHIYNKRHDAILNDCFSGEVPPGGYDDRWSDAELCSTMSTLAEDSPQCFAQVGEDAHQLEALIDAARTVFEQVEVVSIQQSQITLCRLSSARA